MMWDWGFTNMGWFMGVGVLLTIVFWGAIIWLIVWGIRKLSGGGGPSGRQNPLDIARERYARGEISREEFEQIKKDLS
jgi:putative membrane protein